MHLTVYHGARCYDGILDEGRDVNVTSSLQKERREKKVCESVCLHVCTFAKKDACQTIQWHGSVAASIRAGRRRLKLMFGTLARGSLFFSLSCHSSWNVPARWFWNTLCEWFQRNGSLLVEGGGVKLLRANIAFKCWLVGFE